MKSIKFIGTRSKLYSERHYNSLPNNINKIELDGNNKKLTDNIFIIENMKIIINDYYGDLNINKKKEKRNSYCIFIMR